MNSALYFVLLIPFGVALGIGVGKLSHDPTTGALLILPIIVWGFVLVRIMFPYWERREQAERAEIDRQTRELTERVHSLDARHDVREWSTLVPALFTLVLGAVITLRGIEQTQWIACIVGVAMLTLAAGLWLSVWPRLIQPMLTLTREGLQTAAYGFFGWSEIDGLRMTTRHVKGIPFHTLSISVPRLPERRDKMHPFARVLYACRWGKARRTLTFGLTAQGRRSHVVSKAAENLWSAGTGRANAWFPDDLHLTARLRALEEATHGLRDLPRDAGPEAIAAQLKRSEMAADALWKSEQARRALDKRSTMIAVVVMAVIAAVVIWFRAFA